MYISNAYCPWLHQLKKICTNPLLSDISICYFKFLWQRPPLIHFLICQCLCSVSHSNLHSAPITPSVTLLSKLAFFYPILSYPIPNYHAVLFQDYPPSHSSTILYFSSLPDPTATIPPYSPFPLTRLSPSTLYPLSLTVYPSITSLPLTYFTSLPFKFPSRSSTPFF